MIKATILTIAAVAALASCSTDPSTGQCKDVTSYDRNWQNDMKCKRADGSYFYTSYAGARSFEGR